MRIAIYARVSTLDQSCDMQLDDLRRYSKAREFTIFREYIDNGVSGAKASRPELNQLMSDAKQRKFDAVLVWKLDRFGRSLTHLVRSIGELQDYGVAFMSLKDNIDMSTSQGRLLFGIMASFAEFERELIRERVTAGVRRAIEKRHGVWGRKAIPIDLKRVSGLSIRKAAEALGVSRETVRLARNEQPHKTPELPPHDAESRTQALRSLLAE